jgi:DNA polymerase
MNDLDSVISDTIRYLEQLKESGVERVQVSPETLAELSAAPVIRSTPIPQHSTTPPPITPQIQNPKPSLRDAKQSKIDDLEKAAALDAIWQRARVCVKCQELATKRKNVVFGVGNPDARLVFVGEAPGEDEDIQGEPFVGRAGQLLTKIIQAMGLKRSDVYIANILKCRPPANRKPLPEETQNCLPFLKAQLDAIKPDVIVCLGATGLEGLLGLTGITKLRGQWLNYTLTSGKEVLVMPTFHPSYLLRDPTKKRPVWDDMQKVMEKLGLEKPASS